MWLANKNRVNVDAIGERHISDEVNEEHHFVENSHGIVGTDRYGHSLSKKTFPDLNANNFPYKG
tara:strand:- start:165 stop:356 length:192 start_codon:yes stop_codon:yes gene_type:complete